VKQVFENLIGNAIKYMGNQAHPQVEIGWLEDSREVLLFVRDNGMGIEASMTDRIFLPFIRLATSDVPGSGIGLSIVKAVVEEYEGAVTVDSIPGLGSTFYVRLPVISWKPTLPESQAQNVASPMANG
jgi:signal transduction histidine kinase